MSLFRAADGAKSSVVSSSMARFDGKAMLLVGMLTMTSSHDFACISAILAAL
jgi:hypothetical protein